MIRPFRKEHLADDVAEGVFDYETQIGRPELQRSAAFADAAILMRAYVIVDEKG
jgi:hypothetical protein